MRMHLTRVCLGLGVVFALVVAAAGCGRTGGDAKNKAGDKAVAQAEKDGEDGEGGGDHGGWWCVEHGIPEHDCALCSAKVAAEYKKKGDWCKEHDRPESQCFLCDPKRAEKFAAQYRAKYGKEPPPVEPENIKGGESKEGDKDADSKGEKK